MKVFNRNELKALLAPRQGPCLSLYMPTVRAGDQIKQNPIRFKNLLREAQSKLAEHGLSPAEVEEFLAPISHLTIWNEQKDGLALFLAPGFVEHYMVPMEFPERVVVGESFQVKQVLRLLSEDHRFLLLTMALHGVRLFEVTKEALHPIDLGPVEAGMNHLLTMKGIEVEELTEGQRPGGPATDRAGFQGGAGSWPTRQGSEDPNDRNRERIKEYFRAVDEALSPILLQESTPLLLAGVEYLHPIFRECCRYRFLAEKGLHGNFEEVGRDELHARAWEAMGSAFRAKQEQAEARFHQLLGTGLASTEVEQVVTAACQGRIETLFVPVGVQTWGRWIPEEARVELSRSDGNGDGATDLFNLSALQTLMTGGEVLAVDPAQVPGEGQIAAVFRY